MFKQTSLIKSSDDQPFSAKALAVAPGGVEASVVQIIFVPEIFCHLYFFFLIKFGNFAALL